MRLKILCFVVVAVLAKKCSSYTQSSLPGDYMLCRKLPNIFGSINDNVDEEIEIGKPGPNGVTGPQGKKGLPGPRGEPEYKIVQEILNKRKRVLLARLDKMEAELKYLKANPPKFTGPVTGPKQSPDDLINGKKCIDKYLAPINVGTMCYAIYGNDGLSLSLEYAQTNCSKKGGRLANPDSKEAYHRIYDYADKTFHTAVRAWVGLKYENDKLLHNYGSNTTYAKWSNYYPKKSGSYSFYKTYTRIMMYIDTSSFTIALQNVPGTRRSYSYAICEYDLAGPLPTVGLPTTTTEDPDDYDYYNYY